MAKQKQTFFIKKLFWKLSGFFYVIFGYIFSFLSIDSKHHIAQSFNSIIGNIKPIHNLLKKLFKRKKDHTLKQEILGMKFQNPIGTPAGYDKSAKIIPAISALDFGFCTVGSITEKPCIGNPKPWIYKLSKAKSFVVNAGLCNDGSITVSNRLTNLSNSQINQLPIIASIAKTNCREVVDVETGINDYINTIKSIKNNPIIKVIELNISCPNTFGGEPFTTPDKLERLLIEVSKINLKQPIFIKMPVDFSWQNFSELLEVAVKYHISGVTIANLTKDRELAKQQDYIPDKIRGNFSGKLTWNKSNTLIRKTYSNYGDRLVIIGAGGVMSAEDAYIKIRLGASLVETATGFMFHGPQFISELNEQLSKIIKNDGYKNVSQIIGIDSSNAEN